MAAPSDDDADDADDDPSCSHGPRTGLDFLRGPVSEPAPRPFPEPSDESEGWRYPMRKAAQKSPPHQPQAECDDAGWQRPERDEANPVVHDFVGSMRAQQVSTRHHDYIDWQKGLLDKLAAQKKINDYERADPEGARVTRLMRSI
ncbi:unnamed protein product [Closterium sp. NIES-54]